MKVTREQALAFRLSRHHLHERTPSAEEAAFVGLQDTPPGSAATAFAARTDAPQEALDALALVPSLRGAPLAVPPADQAIFTTAIDPPDEEAARSIMGNAWKDLDALTAMEALDAASAAVADALRDGPLVKDDFHQALRERVPEDLLWWCRGCGSHHVHPSLWRATGVRGVLAIVGREGRSPLFGAPPPAPAVDDPGAELARRFLRAYAPSRPFLLAGWLGIPTKYATKLWERAGELAEVDLEGQKAWVLADDAKALAAPPAIAGVRLLPSLDPMAGSKDREVLVGDEAARKRIWAMLGGAGMVLADGEVAGLWRPAKKGKRLVVTVEPLGRSLKRHGDALAAEAERLAAVPRRRARRDRLGMTRLSPAPAPPATRSGPGGADRRRPARA